MIPVWLLDIDGVVNACTPKPDPSIWPRNTWREAKILGFPCKAAQPVLDFILEVHESGRAEIRWHTTWQEDAQKFADEFGMPTLPIQDAPEFNRRLYDNAMQGRDTTWWKRPAAWRVLTQEQRPLIWTDDDITYSLGRRGQDEMRALGPALLIGPNERTGLTPKHLRHIGDFLDLYPADVKGGEAQHAIQS